MAIIGGNYVEYMHCYNGAPGLALHFRMSHPPQSGLNTPQREAVKYLDGPCLVLAGAGSGKTRVITQKIAHLIENCGYDPKNIAALTFTNKAASEMQERIAKLLAEPKQAKHLTISTFHSLGVKILRQEAKHLGLKDRFSILDSDDCFALVQDLAATTDKQLIRRIQNAMSLWKNAMQDPDTALKNALDEDEAQAARIYRSYVATLSAYQAVDFDDLIRLPVELFRDHDEVRDKWQRRLRYLLVDEYQDTNTCQYELVKLLVTGIGKKPLFTAVGDDDQAIYAWRGATIENLKTLQVDFPDLKVIKLEQNYRSTTRILQAANAVIGNNPKLFEKSLWSEHGLGDPIKVLAMEDDEAEADQVAIMLSAHRFERRAKFSDYAILYRGNHQARVIEKALRRERIPYTMSGGQSFFDRAEIKDIISYLRLIANQDDDPAFIRAVTTPKRGVGQATLEALGAYAGQWQCSLFEAMYKGGVEAILSERQLTPLRQFGDFINQLEAHAHREGHAARLLDDMMKEIEYEAYLYNTFDERAAQNKWQNVLDFTTWLKEKGSGGKDGADAEKSLLGPDADGGADDHARRPRRRAGRGAHVDPARVERAGIPARVPGRRRGRHPAAQGRPRCAGRDAGRPHRGRTAPDVRRHHARPAQPACVLVQEAQARARERAVRRLALHQGNEAGRGRCGADRSGSDHAAKPAGEFEGAAGEAEGGLTLRRGNR